MANAEYPITPIAGIDFDARDTAAQFAIGTMVQLNGLQKAAYVQANGVIAASQVDITVSTAGQASDGAGTWINSAIAFADNEYGWVRVADNT